MMTNGSYRDCLQEAFSARCAKNARYSLRAFARDLKMQPSALSEVLSGKRGLSLASAKKVSSLLGFSRTEAENFCQKVLSEDARSKRVRREAKLQIESPSGQDVAKMRAQALTEETYKIVSDWYHYALLELLELAPYRGQSAALARRLEIHPKQVESAIDRMKKIGLLTETPRGLIPATEATHSPDDVPSEAIRSHHEQILRKAESALTLQPVEKRDFHEMTIAVDPRDIPEAKRRIREFQLALGSFLNRSNNRSVVYSFSTQLFALEKGPEAAPSHRRPERPQSNEIGVES